MKRRMALTLALAMLLCALTAANADSVIRVPPVEPQTKTVEAIEPGVAQVPEAEILEFKGELAKDGQTDSYRVELREGGRIRAEVSRLQAGCGVAMAICDEQGGVIESSGYCDNGDGLTAKGLEAGTYEVRVTQYSGHSSYTLSVGLQKKTFDVSGLTLVKDSIEYTDQRNVYSFTVPRDGRYRFELDRMVSGFGVSLYVFNDLGETVDSNGYCRNGDGITLKGLKAGEEYTVQVRQYEGTGSYNLVVGQQKKTVDVSGLTLVKDSIEFTDQRNVYSFTVPRDGRYRFELDRMVSGFGVSLYVFNDLGETVDSNGYCRNGDGLTLKGLKAGEEYTVQVRQYEGTGNYNLVVGQQKPTVDVGHGASVKDSIEYTDQRNVYRFTAGRSGTVALTFTGIQSGSAVAGYVFNDLNETVDSNGYLSNNDVFNVRGLQAGEEYTIEVRQYQGLCEYTMTID